RSDDPAYGIAVARLVPALHLRSPSYRYARSYRQLFAGYSGRLAARTNVRTSWKTCCCGIHAFSQPAKRAIWGKFERISPLSVALLFQRACTHVPSGSDTRPADHTVESCLHGLLRLDRLGY